MKVYLRDHNEGAHTVWKPALCAVGISLDQDLAVLGDGYYGEETPESVRAADACVFLHSSLYRQQWEAGFKSNTFQGHLIHVSTKGGTSLGRSDCDRVHVCHWTPAHFEETCAGRHWRLMKWIEQVKNGDIGKVDWSLLQPAATERVVALRLLCEAWLLVHWDEASTFPKRNELANVLQVDPASYKLPDGILLNAPQSADTWLAPFSGTSDETPVENIAKELQSETTKAAVRKFFTDMETSQPKFPHVADMFLLLDGVVRAPN